MPRMKNTCVRGVIPPRKIVTPGVLPARSRAVVMSCSSISPWVITVTATGVSCTLVDWRVAVTTMSDKPESPDVVAASTGDSSTEVSIAASAQAIPTALTDAIAPQTMIFNTFNRFIKIPERLDSTEDATWRHGRPRAYACYGVAP
jgi:hypothetical protein